MTFTRSTDRPYLCLAGRSLEQKRQHSLVSLALSGKSIKILDSQALIQLQCSSAPSLYLFWQLRDKLPFNQVVFNSVFDRQQLPIAIFSSVEYFQRSELSLKLKQFRSRQNLTAFADTIARTQDYCACCSDWLSMGPLKFPSLLCSTKIK